MSTEFHARSTGELGYVRFYSGARGGACYEFGTVSNFEHVLRQLRAGDKYGPECGAQLRTDPQTVDDLEELVARDLVSFGEMGITIEPGSGDAWRFTVEE